jgi:ATP-binding cassette, subfamily F, member 3
MIKITDASLRRGPRLLFECVSLSFHPGQRVGITGANGIGKTSLFGVLDGTLQTDSGDVSIPPATEIASVSQEVHASKIKALDYVMEGDKKLGSAKIKLRKAELENSGHDLALAYQVYEQIDGYTAETRAAKLLAGLGFSQIEQSKSFADFSGGWRMRLNLARALMCPSDLLLLDEPTNHLDLDAIIWLENWLLGYDGMLLLISHDRDFLDAVCTHVAHIENQRVTSYTGNYSKFEEQRAAHLAGKHAAYLKQQREIEHIQFFVDRFRAKASKAKQAQSRLKSLSRLEVINSAQIDSPFSFRFEEPKKMPNQLITVSNADIGYGDAIVLQNVSMSIVPGDRIGLLGANGAGKSTLIKALVGNLSPMRGDVYRANDLTVSYFAQHQVEQLRGDETPLSFLKRVEPKASEGELRKHLGGFAFSGNAALAPIGPFSGGEKARLVLAAIIRQKPNLLLLDEPTNHLDLQMRHALSLALQGFEGALVVVSHDRHLLQSVCDSLKFVHDGEVEDFSGDLDDYARWLTQSRAETKQSVKLKKEPNYSSKQRKQQKQKDAERRNSLSSWTKQLKEVEKSMSQNDFLLNEVGEKLSSSDLYLEENKEDLERLLSAQVSYQKQHQSNERLWLELTGRLDDVEKSTI